MRSGSDSESDDESRASSKRREKRRKTKRLSSNMKTFNTLRSFPSVSSILPDVDLISTPEAYYEHNRTDWAQERTRKILGLDADAAKPLEDDTESQSNPEEKESQLGDENGVEDTWANRCAQSDDEEVMFLGENRELVVITIQDQVATVEAKSRGLFDFSCFLLLRSFYEQSMENNVIAFCRS